ncbi:MAG: phospholipase effector Tle1 domain-containing protein [Geminicoccaceae bacterium]
MALYAFDGTWNVDEDDPKDDTNIVRFKELYAGSNVDYLEGVGTRAGALGRIVGGLFGVGGRTRIEEMYQALCANWADDDKVIDIVGFSRGAALAVHFANKIGDEGVRLGDGSRAEARIRFLGVFDVVGSFGLSFDTIINFQEINLGWDIGKVAGCVDQCFHAMALDERRESFDVTRLDPDNHHDNVTEVWFRGVHSDIGGGNGNPDRSNIALGWMVDRARDCGVLIHEDKAQDEKYRAFDVGAAISENQDVQRDVRRAVRPGDTVHETALPKILNVNETACFEVRALLKYNWSGVQLIQGAAYEFEIADGDTWKDKNINCGPDGWPSDLLPWYQEALVKLFESRRRVPEANWFELIGAVGDNDDRLFRISTGGSDHAYVAEANGELYAFANDLQSRYDNNEGSLMVEVKRIT